MDTVLFLAVQNMDTVRCRIIFSSPETGLLLPFFGVFHVQNMDSFIYIAIYGLFFFVFYLSCEREKERKRGDLWW